MNKICNAAFSTILILFLLGPATLWLSQEKLHLDLPSWLTTEDAQYLAGGIETTNLKSSLNFKGFFDGTLQSGLEAKINNYTPSRANVILLNAALQQQAIKVSNALFSWNCYPTFYGSTILYDHTSDTLLESPFFSCNNGEETLSDIDVFGETLAGFAQDHQEIEFCVIIPELREKSPINPAWDLVSQKFSISSCSTLWSQQSESLDNVHIIYDAYEDYTTYLENYYHFDPHWNGYGAIASYNLAAEELELPLLSQVPPAIALDQYVFYGNLGRQGRMLIDRPVSEPFVETEGFAVSNSIKGAMIRANNEVDPTESIYASFNFYAWLYGDDVASDIKNESAPSDETVLVISDSFGDAFRWVVASRCRETHSLYSLHRSSKKDNVRLIHVIERIKPTKIIFVGSIINYSTFLKRHPSYFTTN